MKNLPLFFTSSDYKYTIIARLLTLQGAESKLDIHKSELINYLKRKGYSDTSIRRWLTAKVDERSEMPAAALLVVQHWFNRKYAIQSNSEQQVFLHLEDLLHPNLRA